MNEDIQHTPQYTAGGTGHQPFPGQGQQDQPDERKQTEHEQGKQPAPEVRDERTGKREPSKEK